ncbi:ROK family transcriptional regulator [Nonomuraea typhae]|uniref:ROK family transcriptional regulator n=1 Tax=Nonomuraea typhae TaxID=2603600 RepID=A0ABW7Z4C5_9ACTN
MRMGTNLPKVGDYNRAVVLEAVQVSDGISRVQIAERTGLTPQTVSVIVRKLLEDGLVVEDGSAPGTGGKPRTILRVDAAAGYAVGIHFDPESVSYVLADLAGRPLVKIHRPVRRAEPEPVVRNLARTARRLLKEAGVPGGKVLGVGLASPGPLDPDGVIVNPPRLPGWDGVPIRSLLERHVGYPVTVDNDATAAAIGERWAGLARTVPSFVYLYLGTGIGGGLFLDGQVYRGRTLNAAEFGHITVMPDGPACYCGNRGCVEALCCPDAIVATVRERLALGAESALAGRRLSHAAVCAAAAAGDPLAASVTEEAADRLADAAVSVVNMLDVDLLVVGGPAVRELGGLYREVIGRAVATRVLARGLQAVQVAVSPIAADAAAIGAASLVFHVTYAPRLDRLIRE